MQIHPDKRRLAGSLWCWPSRYLSFEVTPMNRRAFFLFWRSRNRSCRNRWSGNFTQGLRTKRCGWCNHPGCHDHQCCEYGQYVSQHRFGERSVRFVGCNQYAGRTMDQRGGRSQHQLDTFLSTPVSAARSDPGVQRDTTLCTRHGCPRHGQSWEPHRLHPRNLFQGLTGNSTKRCGLLPGNMAALLKIQGDSLAATGAYSYDAGLRGLPGTAPAPKATFGWPIPKASSLRAGAAPLYRPPLTPPPGGGGTSQQQHDLSCKREGLGMWSAAGGLTMFGGACAVGIITSPFCGALWDVGMGAGLFFWGGAHFIRRGSS